MRNLSEISGMPQMGRAFAGWQRPITLAKVIQRVVDALVQQSTVGFTFMGVIQPLISEEIALKPEGQRAWSWLQIHCSSTWNAPSSVSTAQVWDSPVQTWDTPGQTYDATGPNSLLTIWRNLNVNDQIYYNGEIYKVMARKDYSLNGYIEYHVVKDFQ